MPFTIYADFETLLNRVRGSDKKIILHALKNIRKTFLAVLPIKLSVLMINLVKQLFFIEEKMQSRDLLKQFWTRMIIGKKVIKNHFKRNLVISAEDEQRFQSSSKCWIYDKVFDIRDNKAKGNRWRFCSLEL